MEDSKRRRGWAKTLGLVGGGLVALILAGLFLASRADGPVFVFAGGPLTSGELVDFADLEWTALDDLHELEMEIVAAESSRTLWFSVHDGAAYVACDLDCIDGRLSRWPQQIERDDRVVMRIDGRRVEGRLVHVPHGTAEYRDVKAGRSRKYAGDEGGRAAAETAAHGAVVGVGEVLTGRAQREEPGDRMYRFDRR